MRLRGSAFACDQDRDLIAPSAVETSENLFNVLGVQPAAGRGFTVHADLFGPEQEAIISHRLWQTRFGGDPAVLGRAISGGKSGRAPEPC